MSNENFPNTSPSPDLSEPASGTGVPPQPPVAPAPPVPPMNDQFLPEHVETDSASRVGAAHGGQDESKLAQAGEATKDLAAEGQHSAAEVMDTAKQEATMVAGQAKEQAAHLFEELGADLREQTSLQQRKVAENLRDISNEFRSMLDQSQATGTAATLVDQASHHSGRVADWLDQREPGDLVDEVKDFARKRPGAFLGIALGAGLLAGRITRNASASKERQRQSPEATADAPAGTSYPSERPHAEPLKTAPRVTPPPVGQADPSALRTGTTEDELNDNPLQKYPGLNPRPEDYR